MVFLSIAALSVPVFVVTTKQKHVGSSISNTVPPLSTYLACMLFQGGRGIPVGRQQLLPRSAGHVEKLGS